MIRLLSLWSYDHVNISSWHMRAAKVLDPISSMPMESDWTSFPVKRELGGVSNCHLWTFPLCSNIYIWLQAHRCAWELNKQTIFDEDNLSWSIFCQQHAVKSLVSILQTTILFVCLKAKTSKTLNRNYNLLGNDNNDSSLIILVNFTKRIWK